MAGQDTIIHMSERGSPEVSMSVSSAASKGLVACIYLFVASHAPIYLQHPH